MSGELRTQKTQVFLLNTVDTTGDVEEIKNVTDVGEFGPQADDIDATNLMSDAKEYFVGLPDNGQADLQINFDPTDPVHQLLNDIAGTANRLQFMVCLSDGTASPTEVSGVLTAPANRTSAKFTASVKSFRGSVKANDLIRDTCSLRISGAISWTYAT
jgi:hypothetical protein